jgi:hypothetical protein
MSVASLLPPTTEGFIVLLVGFLPFCVSLIELGSCGRKETKFTGKLKVLKIAMSFGN